MINVLIVMLLSLFSGEAEAQDILTISPPECPDGCHIHEYVVVVERTVGPAYKQTWTVPFPSRLNLLLSSDWQYLVSKEFRCEDLD